MQIQSSLAEGGIHQLIRESGARFTVATVGTKTGCRWRGAGGQGGGARKGGFRFTNYAARKGVQLVALRFRGELIAAAHLDGSQQSGNEDGGMNVEPRECEA